MSENSPLKAVVSFVSYSLFPAAMIEPYVFYFLVAMQTDWGFFGSHLCTNWLHCLNGKGRFLLNLFVVFSLQCKLIIIQATIIMYLSNSDCQRVSFCALWIEGKLRLWLELENMGLKIIQFSNFFLPLFQVVGRSFMPPYWSLGFHLCRWGYLTANRTLDVVKRMRAREIPQVGGVN